MANTIQKESKIIYLQIGQNYENLGVQKQFDVSEWTAEFPDAHIYLLFKRPGEEAAAPVNTTLDEAGILTWTVSNWETGIIGIGFAEIRAIDSSTGLVKKSHVIPCSIEASVTDEDAAPDYPSWVDRMLRFGENVDSIYATLPHELEEGIASIQQEAQTQIAAIEQKGITTRASIPADYTTLSDDVTELKNDLPGENSANLFDKSQCVSGGFLNGPDGSEPSFVTNSAYSYYILHDVEYMAQYCVSGTNFNYFILGSDGKIITHGGNSDNKTNFVITITRTNAVDLVINFRHEQHPIDEYMIVKGDAMPSEYQAYGIYLFFEKPQEAIEKIVDAKIEPLISHELVYYVGRGGSTEYDFADPISCFNAVKGITNHKTIHIYEADEGSYDLYSLMGGAEFFESIDPTTQTTYDVQPWLENVHIIGHGKVVLDLKILGNIPQNTRWLFSPLNIRGDCTIENITVTANSCRYCIHDESSVNYPHSKHVYKNVRCKYLGSSQAVGCGYSEGSTVVMEDCVFESTNSWAYSFHTRGYVDMLAKNCVFITGHADRPPVRISQETDHIIKAKFESCFMKSNGQNGIHLRPENTYTSSPANHTNVTILNCNVSSILNEYSSNSEPSVKYDITTGEEMVLIPVA